MKMNEKKSKKKLIVILVLLVVLISISATAEVGLKISDASFWLSFAIGGLFTSFIKNSVLYFKKKEE